MKARQTKPIKYDSYFLDGLKEMRDSETIDFNNLNYRFKRPRSAPISFIGFKCPLHIFNSIYNGHITLEDVEKDHRRLKSDLGHIKSGNPKDKIEEQFKAIGNVNNLYESREKLSNCLIIMLKIFRNQNKEKDLKY